MGFDSSLPRTWWSHGQPGSVQAAAALPPLATPMQRAPACGWCWDLGHIPGAGCDRSALPLSSSSLRAFCFSKPQICFSSLCWPPRDLASQQITCSCAWFLPGLLRSSRRSILCRQGEPGTWALLLLPNLPAPCRKAGGCTQPSPRRKPLPCCTTFLHLLSFNVLIKWLIREVIHEKDGYLDKTQKLVAALSPQISILHKRERQKRQIFVPLSFHHCSSKDQSLQKINLKENFWCIWWSLVVDRSAAGSIWSMQSQSWDYLKVSVVLWLTSVYFIFYMAQSEPYIDNILLLLFNTWNSPFSCSV